MRLTARSKYIKYSTFREEHVRLTARSKSLKYMYRRACETARSKSIIYI